MMRSPLFYPLNRGKDAEAGGVADLQTDVMRFMAILALCLVAIFALVQSIPLAPSIVEPEPTPGPEPRPQPVEQPQPAQVVEPMQEIVLTRPQPRQPLEPPRQEQQTQKAQQAKPQPVETEPVVEGFTLRFEDELALTRLVSRDEVGLYAIQPDRSFRMSINRGAMSFWPASTPNQFHEMDATTVPPAVLEAFVRRDGSTAQTLQWGVTIPAATSRQLEQHLREADGGALIIDARGDLRLEQ
jgi:hypothetical protein